jgi:hypothetical protein
MLRMFIMACSSFCTAGGSQIAQKGKTREFLVQAQVTEKYRLVTQVKKDCENRSANIY